MSNQIARRSSLGLLGAVPLDFGAAKDEVKQIPLSAIKPNNRQVRTDFHDDSLRELADSISRHGLLQPVVVRRLDDSATAAPAYELIAGERRWRAHQLLKKETISAIIRPAQDGDMRVLALLENVQREDLSVVDRAQAIQELKREMGGKVEAVAEALGISRRLGFLLARIGDAPAPLKDLIRRKNADLRTADQLITLAKDWETRGTAPLDALYKELDQAPELARPALDALRAKHWGERPAAPAPTTKGGDAPRAGFWKTDRELGLTLRLSKKSLADRKAKEALAKSAAAFFKAAGAKKIEIKF
jgi:ParB/RepB/Spo0J family partition protein